MNEFRADVELKTIGPADAVQAITWNFRGQAFTAPAKGTAADVRKAFQTTPIRQIQGEALARSPAPIDWRVEGVELRHAPGLVRLVAVGAGVGCILFEGPEAPLPERLAVIRQQVVGLPIEAVLKLVPEAW